MCFIIFMMNVYKLHKLINFKIISSFKSIYSELLIYKE